MKTFICKTLFLFLLFYTDQAHALTSGTTTTGSITAGGTSNQTFTGTAGQGVVLNVYAAYNINIRVYKPDGTLWTSNGNRMMGNLPVTGTYTVTLYSNTPTASGSYDLYYVRGSDSVSGGALTSGQTKNGTLATNAIASFQITGTAGQGINLHASASYPVYIYLYNPDGSYWYSATNRLGKTLPTTGTYTVVIYASLATYSGSYDLYYVRGSDSVSGGALTSGQTKNGTLATNAIASFQITGTAGQGINLHTSASYPVYIYLYNPDGSYWSSGTNRFSNTLPATGTYTVVIYASLATYSGSYDLYYVRGSDNVSDGTLLTTQTRSGLLNANALKSYKLSGVAGNALSIATTGTFTRTLYIYKPDGSYWASASNNYGNTLPATGEYTLVIYGLLSTYTGDYSVTMTTPPAPIAPTTPSKDGVYAYNAFATCPEDETDATGGTGNAVNKMVGNPISFDVGYKKQTAVDYNAGGLSFKRVYRSDSTWTDNTVGQRWRHNFARTLTVNATTASITDGTGATTNYTLSGGNWVANDADIMATFRTITGGYAYTLPDNTVEKYNSAKLLTRIEYLGGGALNFTYNGSNQLTSVTNENGRQLTLTYTSGRVATLVTPDGTYSYAYDANENLKTVTKPDTKTIQYHYENATYVNALTGITDETGIRFATFDYDATGKAILTKHAGNVSDYTVTYNADGTSTTTNPLGKQTTFYYTNILGLRKVVQVDGAASTNCVSANKYYNYDAKGRIIGKTDWKGNTTNYLYDSRSNITQITEGAGTADQRITTITYDPTYNLPDVITETGKTTDYSYDSFGRMTGVTITDTASSEVRTTTYSYYSNTTDPSGNPVLGRLYQINGPRTDVSDITTYAYDTNFNLTTVTNPLSQVTTITARDSAGRPTTIQDMNGVNTVLTYDSNGMLKTSTSASGTALAATTTYDYDANSNLVKITMPSGQILEYSYDSAQRMTGVKDALNNTITYTLDDAGNTLTEVIKDASATLKYTHTRAYDEISRIIQSVGAASQTETFAYDKNSNLTSYTDANTNATSYAYDALNRFTSTTDALSGVTQLGYNVRDDLTSVKDPRNNTTTYTRNAFGDVTAESSPDRGSTSYTVDKAGNITQRTDARSIVTNFTYDALNRLLTIAYPSDSTLNATLTYDLTTGCGSAGKGHLCRVVDASGTTTYEYDVLSRLTKVTEARTGATFVTQYAYDLAGNLTGITLPSGRTITYTLNANKQISGVSALVGGSATTLASGITYAPFGGITGLTYGNSKTFTAAYDTDYRLTSRAVSGLYSYTYDTDNNGNITQKGSTTYAYDALNRLNGENAGAAVSYTYDANDNRLTKVDGGTTTTTVPAASNKISAVGGTSYSYDSAGNITAIGAQSYVWNAAGQMKEVKVGGLTVGDYVYNASNQRTAKLASGSTQQFVYGKGGLLYGEYDNTGALVREYIYLNGSPLAQVDAGSPEVLTYLHTDHLGTPRFGTNTAGTQVWSWYSDAFGNGTPSGSVTVNLRMPGQYYDSQSGLFYNWNRYYNPATGRYVSSDPIGLGGGLNTFSYAEASPVMYSDPEGLTAVVDDAVGVAVCVALPEVCIGAAVVTVAGVCYATDCINGAIDWCTGNANTQDEEASDEEDSGEEASSNDTASACSPPAGTICYFFDQVPPSKQHHPFPGDHYHLYRHNQLPDGTCRWNKYSDAETLPSNSIPCPFTRAGGR